VSAVQTDCSSEQLSFQAFGGRRVEGRFDAGRTTSDAGWLALREIETRRGWLERFAECFVDHREASRVEHAISVLVKQRILGIVAGYEDVNDHETLRDDALLALACGQEDLVGERRARERDQGHALAGKSTLNRLEHAVVEERPSRYRRVAVDPAAIEGQFVECMIEAHDEAPERIVLDLDATDDPVHGHQEGRFFHGYYRSYCYLPLYIFCGDHLLCAKLRPANQDGAAGSVEEVARIVEQIRGHWPEVEIWLRGDSGFAREALMAWCEANGVHYVLGLAKNARLNRAIGEALEAVRREQEATGMAARQYRELCYRTKKSWTRERRVVAKAEQLPGKTNPRFVVTSLTAGAFPAQVLYETIYCARGDMENRIKEQQLDLFADRTSTATMAANQLRLWFASMAYVLVAELRRRGLQGTSLENAQAGTIRTRLLKIAGLVKISARRVYVSLSSVHPLQHVFAQAIRQLQSAPA
jgi:hypothetical protein